MVDDIYFRTARADGSLQFDADQNTYVYLTKGSVVTVDTKGLNPHWTNSSPSSALVPFTPGSDHLIAASMAPGYSYARYAELQHPNGNWYQIYHTDAPVGAVLNWWKFAPCVEVLGTSGAVDSFLELRNAANQITFSWPQVRPMVVEGWVNGLGGIYGMTAGKQYASIAQTLAGKETFQWEGGYEDIENEKGQFEYRQFPIAIDGKLHGVKWLSSNVAQLVPVSFNDIISFENTTNQAQTAPVRASGTTYDIPIRDLQFVNVTGL